MLFQSAYQIQMPVTVMPDQKLALFQAKKMLPEYVFDTAQLENNPLTFPEVQILMDGITIGGHKVSDVAQILNIKSGWLSLLQAISVGNFQVTKQQFHTSHSLIAREGALAWGAFRTGKIGFNTLMLAFYDTQRADEIMRFLDQKCLHYVVRN